MPSHRPSSDGRSRRNHTSGKSLLQRNYRTVHSTLNSNEALSTTSLPTPRLVNSLLRLHPSSHPSLQDTRLTRIHSPTLSITISQRIQMNNRIPTMLQFNHGRIISRAKRISIYNHMEDRRRFVNTMSINRTINSNQRIIIRLHRRQQTFNRINRNENSITQHPTGGSNRTLNAIQAIPKQASTSRIRGLIKVISNMSRQNRNTLKIPGRRSQQVKVTTLSIRAALSILKSILLKLIRQRNSPRTNRHSRGYIQIPFRSTTRRRNNYSTTSNNSNSSQCDCQRSNPFQANRPIRPAMSGGLPSSQVALNSFLYSTKPLSSLRVGSPIHNHFMRKRPNARRDAHQAPYIRHKAAQIALRLHNRPVSIPTRRRGKPANARRTSLTVTRRLITIIIRIRRSTPATVSSRPIRNTRLLSSIMLNLPRNNPTIRLRRTQGTRTTLMFSRSINKRIKALNRRQRPTHSIHLARPTRPSRRSIRTTRSTVRKM